MLLNQFPDKDRFCQIAKEKNVIPLCIEILTDMETPVSILKKFYRQKGPMFLLESVEGGERWGRYSFLGTSARAEIRVYKHHVEIEEKNGEKEIFPHDGDPLKVLKAYMDPFKPALMNELPRFWGGMVGYMTYEMVSFFERIPNQFEEDKPLAHFIIPDELMIFDNIRNTLQVLVISYLEETSNCEVAYDAAQKQMQEMMAKIRNTIPKDLDEGAPPTLSPIPKYDAEMYRENVKQVRNYIYAGDIIQAVISQPFICEAPDDNAELYRAQRYINPSPYLFFLHMGETALVGSSPETMVRLENGIATLRPIAGTRPRGKSEPEDRALADEMLKDEKERAEHLMLVDLGRNDLGRVAETGTVQVTDLMVVERYSHVMHLVSNITCDLKPEYDAWDLIRSTFPAGTLSGAPKVRAMEIIHEMEKEPRGPYGGAVGYIAFNGNMDLAITIRTACIENDQLVVRAGAGIVADSDPEKERIETENKAKAIHKALKLMQGRLKI